MSLPPKHIIPLEPAPEAGEPSAFTDVVLALHLEDMPYHEAGGAVSYDPDELMEAASAAFAFGCALALDFPDRVPLILEQTHPGEGEAIVADCAGPLKEQAAEAHESGEEIGAELFLAALFEALEESEPVEADTAYNVISIGFEYGCILAQVERRGAMLVRNNFNRELAAVARVENEAAQPKGRAGGGPAGPEPVQTLQQMARQLLEDYEKEIGFSPAS